MLLLSNFTLIIVESLSGVKKGNQPNCSSVPLSPISYVCTSKALYGVVQDFNLLSL